jgi:hypothetical protein
MTQVHIAAPFFLLGSLSPTRGEKKGEVGQTYKNYKFEGGRFCFHFFGGEGGSR